MHKAIAIQVFSTAITSWGSNILTAAKIAADVTGVSAYTVINGQQLFTRQLQICLLMI